MENNLRSEASLTFITISFTCDSTSDVNTDFKKNRFSVVENWFKIGFRFHWAS